MNYSSDAAEQIVRMSLNGVDYAAKLSGKAAERIAVLMFAVLKNQKKTKGKIRLSNMLRSEKPLRVLGIRDEELRKFCEEAKKYGVLYCVLKDNKADDGITDVFIRSDDASKVNRIFERFSLTTIDMASVKADIISSKEKQNAAENKDEDQILKEFINKISPEKETAKNNEGHGNPTTAPTSQSRRSEPTFKSKTRFETDGEDFRDHNTRKSVRKEMDKIRTQKIKDKGIKPNLQQQVHIPVPKKRHGKER